MQQFDSSDPVVVRLAAPAERAAVLAVLTLGFAGDPFNRWLFPEGRRFLEAFPAMADAFGGRAFEAGSAYLGAPPQPRAGAVASGATSPAEVVAMSGDVHGAALWLPPGVEPDRERLMGVILQNVSAAVAGELAEVGQAMGAYHAQAGDCWYLPLLAVDPIHQGRGVGASLLVEALRRIDQEGRPAYLESSNPRNVPLYLRHGFEVMGEIRAGSSPTMTPMFRAPRGAH